MSSDHIRKHRHDEGHVDHGPVTTERTTQAIQALMAVTIVLTGVLVLFALLATKSGGM